MLLRSHACAILLALASAPYVSAQAAAYGQCGGVGWTGSTTCIAGYYCDYVNEYYSQCLPSSGSASSSSSSSSSHTTSSPSTSTSSTSTHLSSTSTSTSTSSIHSSSSTTTSTSSAPSTSSTPPAMVYGQCGGVEWTGPTTCAAGSTCYYVNEYYSQCLPLSSSSTPKSTSTSTSSVLSSSTTSHTSSSSSSTSSAPSTSPPAPTGFVMTSGQTLYVYPSKEVYMVAGTNAYWLAQLSDADIHTALTDIANAGLTTVRTWGFNDVTTIPTSGAYFQLWKNGTATFNTGANGIQRFDAVIAAAKSLGLRLIVVLTNNWSDFGGMDVYVSQLSPGGTHDQFYTNNIILGAYLTYVTEFVARYIDEPTIMAWELANQPRCLGSSGTQAPNCDPSGTTINDWAYVVSGYVKAIDPNHLVGIGDEGFFEESNPSSYPYGPGVGIDFASNMEIPTVDFGTFHSFPDAWGQSGNETAWGKQWIADHFAIQKSVNKPVLLESFGVTSNQASVYDEWWQDIVSLGLTGDLIWQAGSELSTGPSPDDGFAVYPTGPVYPVMSAAAEALKARGYPIDDSKN